ncbi:MAG: hypothetical protein ACI82G_002659, partial [Bradymonadia bacterium]
ESNLDRIVMPTLAKRREPPWISAAALFARSAN